MVVTSSSFILVCDRGDRSHIFDSCCGSCKKVIPAPDPGNIKFYTPTPVHTPRT